METIALTIDGSKVSSPAGTSILEAARQHGIKIPNLCYHPDLKPYGACRMCLVEVEKAPKPLPACATPVTDGMKVQTQSELARDAQKGTMEFLLINHPLDCPICDQGGECELQDLAVGYGRDASQYSEGKRVVMDKNLGPLISTDMTRCIQCTRCVRFGQELAVLISCTLADDNHAVVILRHRLANPFQERAFVEWHLREQDDVWRLTRRAGTCQPTGRGDGLGSRRASLDQLGIFVIRHAEAVLSAAWASEPVIICSLA